MREPTKSGASDEDLRRILSDRGLSSFGDVLVNFLFSLASTRAYGTPKGEKVSNKALAEALRAAGLRDVLPSGMDRHALGNAAETIMAYAWLKGLIATEKYVEILSRNVDEPVEAFKEALTEAWRKLSNNQMRGR